MRALPEGTTEERLRSALEASGHRHTAQRAAIYHYLKGVTTHPTADEIFTQVREVLPDISLATVYKALEAFVESGVARKLPLGGGSARYDGRTDDHDHVRCLRCGKVRDVVGAHDSDLIRGLDSEEGFEILDYRLELIGYCPDCQN
ncbi:MAG: transcriptional repressor [Gemmatimonadetes bacterium]|uniref:Transcriptional repressor n=1 Tax=Candidatus Kutchimonas denitrificans TaxID=3056748 RepID=A0AAE4Z8C9_9BACT|nr:transcriptional repressor [Gemmatimonadota bacterium]NIR74362.1 transcriptional repressor [Candidatus Kutchimonas denitrificans]NIS02613.1 transcriptional repressor [Gemmatimonadota bacterium]NIT68488.1 transcriptional repressor [Gemmatimonadota bacterium]NIU51965.1 transcriptional repressor [Gemmatimonadota bacterium]